ncbi:MAG: hypothetical protein IIA82_07305 [Thaumarchaeota archaeon]|nr:hypothetical protein [Nitrososphaerota archaeon]
MRHYLNGVVRCDCMGCRSADKHREEMVDKLQDEEKKIDEIANKDEIKKKEEDNEDKKANMELSLEELDEILESLRAEIENLKNPDKEDDKQSKQAIEMVYVDNSRSTRSGSKLEHIGYDNSNSKYSVLVYKTPSSDSQDGDALLILMGSSK